MTTPELRVGQGYDIHRLERGYRLTIGGVLIPADRGAVGHSDGDVLIHAVVDALLGAVKGGDIGRRYPDTDVQNRDADSRRFLGETAVLVRACGWELVNIDASVLLESPKLTPYISVMENNLASVLGLDTGRVSVKAKTNELQDAIGSESAVACHAVVLLMHGDALRDPR